MAYTITVSEGVAGCYDHGSAIFEEAHIFIDLKPMRSSVDALLTECRSNSEMDKFKVKIVLT